MRVATCISHAVIDVFVISIHATHAGGDIILYQWISCNIISIHATHAGGDVGGEHPVCHGISISIHATHAGGDNLSDFG